MTGVRRKLGVRRGAATRLQYAARMSFRLRVLALSLFGASTALIGGACEPRGSTTQPSELPDEGSASDVDTGPSQNEDPSGPDPVESKAETSADSAPVETTGDAAGEAERAEGDSAEGDSSKGNHTEGESAERERAEGEVAATAPKKAPEKLELPPPLFPKIREGCGGAAGVGQRVKSFKLANTSGKTIAPSYYRGRVVLLNFWGTWCKPCLKELPEFSRLYRRYRKYGLTLVAVATDDDVEAVKALIAEKKISAKVAVGGEATAAAYGDRNFPFTFVVDDKGVIRAAYDGYKEGCLGAVERDIREQLEIRNR